MLFRMFAASAHGKKYLERGLPCQDVSDTLEFDGVQAIAVADGHGGKDYFRSDTGAKLAVEIAFKQIKKFCSELNDDEIFSDNGIKIFEHSIWNGWREAVINHWRENPVTDAEFRWQTVSEKYKARFTSTDEKILAKYIPVAYGTTLICAVSIGAQVLITQIGDGTCVVLQRNGEFKTPVPPDSENILNVVTSLCDSDAVSKFRHVVLDCDENFPLAPAAIFLSSDGLDDCYPVFENEKYLYKLYDETIVAGLIENGFDSTEQEIRDELLPYMTARGSNDDISLAYLLTEDLNLLKATVEKISQPVTEKISQPVTEKISQPDTEKVSPPDTEKFSSPDTEKVSSPVTEKISSPVTEKISPPATVNAEKNSPPVTADNVTEKFSPTPLVPIFHAENPALLHERQNLTLEEQERLKIIREKLRASKNAERSDNHEQP